MLKSEFEKKVLDLHAQGIEILSDMALICSKNGILLCDNKLDNELFDYFIDSDLEGLEKTIQEIHTAISYIEKHKKLPNSLR